MSSRPEHGGVHLEQAHFRLLVDCAAICQFSADFMLRGHTFLIRLAGFVRLFASYVPKDANKRAGCMNVYKLAVAVLKAAQKSLSQKWLKPGKDLSKFTE